MLLTLIFASALTIHADPVKVSGGDLACKVSQFSSRPNKKAYRVCVPLLDSVELPVKSMGECRERVLAKGHECLRKLSAEQQVAVQAKFTEKVGVTTNTTTFTCELDQKGGVSCP